jgi:hypothetical protein
MPLYLPLIQYRMSYLMVTYSENSYLLNPSNFGSMSPLNSIWLLFDYLEHFGGFACDFYISCTFIL